MQVSEDRRIWISYFDEGVFGNTRLGQSGLVCLDDRGGCDFDFATLVSDEVPSIDDCYAMNVCSNREVRLCYYTDFPLVWLLDGKPEGVWSVGGPRGNQILRRRRALQKTEGRASM